LSPLAISSIALVCAEPLLSAALVAGLALLLVSIVGPHL
jgi:hypothetical protein